MAPGQPEKSPKPNKPCPRCNSGKKYSKCCQQKDIAEQNRVVKEELLERERRTEAVKLSDRALVLYEGKDVRASVVDLLARSSKDELTGEV